MAEDALSVASQHSIGLIDIKWASSMCPHSRQVTGYVRDIRTCSSEKCPQCPLALVGAEFLEIRVQHTDSGSGKLQGVRGED